MTKCPNCDSMLNWHSVNLSMRLASDASFVDSDFTCDVCGAELTLTFDLAEVLVGGEEPEANKDWSR